MSLYLVEFANAPAGARPLLESAEAAVRAAGAAVVEGQHASDLARLYVIVDAADEDRLRDSLAGLPAHDLAAVRLVGATLEQAKAAAGADANFLVEWDLPGGLSMDRYLARKKEKAPRYATVPEVAFRRTYVREDMDKCLCLYDAPDADCVRRARAAVETPIDRLSPLERSAQPERTR